MVRFGGVGLYVSVSSLIQPPTTVERAKEGRGGVWCWRIGVRDGAFLGSGCVRERDRWYVWVCGSGWTRLEVGLNGMGWLFAYDGMDEMVRFLY